jgi:hypothetical protein
MSQSQIITHVRELLKSNPKKLASTIVDELADSSRYPRTGKNTLSVVVKKCMFYLFSNGINVRMMNMMNSDRFVLVFCFQTSKALNISVLPSV